ncbi:hypothetical protein Dsin_018215 [Dipteronia sinensis]|uniref:RING-type E3 ubiquitin transferase n=1 Tax=Dipteronia sinensis TaxID=43782 RepID=A0AAE0A5M6_9ROSI|nr:hypothetical protein Dsin_018215 [Dipteronia sinensis]
MRESYNLKLKVLGSGFSGSRTTHSITVHHQPTMDPIPIRLINPPKTQKYRSHPRHRHLLLQLLFIFSLLAATATSENDYTKYCSHIVPESPIDPTKHATLSASQSLFLTAAFFSGGDPFFHFDPINWPKSAKFIPSFARRTANDSVVNVQARLILTSPRPNNGNVVRFRNLRQQLFSVRGPKFPVRRGVARFRLSGYWSESNGRLCMVGSGSKYENSGKVETFNVVLKLNYSNRLNMSVVDRLVTGVLESVDVESSKSYFKPVSILGVAQFDDRHYEYPLLDKENDTVNWFVGGTDQDKSLSIDDVDRGVCSVLGSRTFMFELDYGDDCDSGNVSCNPVAGNVGDVPSTMFFKGIRCEEKQKMQMMLGFWNSSFMSARFPFDPITTLIAEGYWDEKRNQLLGVACRILNFTESLTNAYVGDCSVRLSLRFPAVFSIRNRNTIFGQIWSNKSENDPKYFGKIGFGSSEDVLVGLPGFKYDYSLLDVARKSCVHKNRVRHKGKTYPNAYSVDMRFDMSIKNSKGQKARGFASPLFVGDRFFEHQLYGRQLVKPSLRSNASVVQLISNHHSSLLNISYKMSFTPEFGFKFGGGGEMSPSETVKISAEGIYYKDTGVLCMIGCRQLGSGHLKENLTKNVSLDCEIVINVQFRALNVEGSENVKGTIESTREKLDPLNFGRLELSSNSIYTRQAVDSVWRMDLEITMVLISNTLACVFVGIQLYYVKQHPDVLPFISVVMLIILTLRYMIPLLLNFEALFKANSNQQQNIFLGSGGWLETNEIIVRVVTMVAFLLQFRLLQLTWSARQGDGSQKDLWISEKKVLYVCLPLYIAGGLIAWAVYLWKNSYHSHILNPRLGFHRRWNLYNQHSLWGDLKSYAGLLLDGFLLPQIMLNALFNSTEKALAASFYLGSTLVRLLPHAYDLYRSHSSGWYNDMSYIYANPKMDLYSTAWDIIIPCGGLLFAAIIFFQQRLSGRCIMPKRFRDSSGYEKVSVVSSVELQEDAVNKNSYIVHAT